MRRPALLLALLCVAADPAARLAPGPGELAESVRETGRRLERAEALEVTVTRHQNAWGERLAAGTAPARPCDDPAARALLAGLAAFGPAWRDAAQAARAERDRLVEIAAAPTVQPLLDPELRAAVETLDARVAAQETAWREVVAWQSAFARVPRDCDLTPEPSPGLADPVPRPLAETHPTAVLAIGGGVVCPLGAPADGRVLVVSEPICVQAREPCTCEARPVLPGAMVAAPD